MACRSWVPCRPELREVLTRALAGRSRRDVAAAAGISTVGLDEILQGRGLVDDVLLEELARGLQVDAGLLRAAQRG